jgi:restriction system protein
VVLGGCIAYFRSGKEPSSSYTANVFAPVPDLASGAKFRDPTLPKFDFTPPVRKPVTTAELMAKLRSIDWFQFEKLVALTYRKLGFTVCRRGGANPDGGIDLLIRKDGETSAVQCKQWRNTEVGVRQLREFLGALTDAKVQKGIFVTLRGYSDAAKQLADKHGIEILDETGLARMLESTDVVFTPEAARAMSDETKRCPKCEREMVLRTAGKGPDAGKQFWGCSGYPKCRFTMQLSTGQPRTEFAAVRKTQDS